MKAVLLKPFYSSIKLKSSYISLYMSSVGVQSAPNRYGRQDTLPATPRRPSTVGTSLEMPREVRLASCEDLGHSRLPQMRYIAVYNQISILSTNRKVLEKPPSYMNVVVFRLYAAITKWSFGIYSIYTGRAPLQTAWERS